MFGGDGASCDGHSIIIIISSSSSSNHKCNKQYHGQHFQPGQLVWYLSS
jgi:hypothetical protein